MVESIHKNRTQLKKGRCCAPPSKNYVLKQKRKCHENNNLSDLQKIESILGNQINLTYLFRKGLEAIHELLSPIHVSASMSHRMTWKQSR